MMRSRVAVALAFAVVACSEFEPTAPESPVIAPQFSVSPAFGSTTDIEEVHGLPSLSTASGFETGFRNAVAAQFGDASAMERILGRWLTTLINARLRSANTDTELFLALSDFDSWLFSAESLFPDAQTRFQAELDAFDQVAATKLEQAIDGNLGVCRANQSFSALANVIMWYEQAEVLALPGGPHWTLTDDIIRSLIRDFCITVEVTSIAFPNPVDAGQPFTLHTNSAVRFNGQTATVPAAFEMQIGYNPPFTFIASFTDASGHYETPLSFPLAGTVTVNAVACLVLPARSSPTYHVCGDRTVTGNVLNPPPPPPPPPTSPVDVSGIWEADFSYTAGPDFFPARITLVLSQTGGGASGTWSLDDGLHRGAISFSIGGIDPACPGCGYLITDFNMTGVHPGVFFLNTSTGGRHVGEPHRGRSIVMDLAGTDGHGTDQTVHHWLSRRVMFRPIDP